MNYTLSYESLFDIPLPRAQSFPWINFNSAIDQPSLPPPPRPKYLEGLLDDGDIGHEGKFAVWKNAGWEVQPVQPRWPTMPGGPGPSKHPDAGDQGIQPFSVWRLWGEAYSAAGKWPYAPGSPNPGKNPEFGDQGIQRPFSVWAQWGEAYSAAGKWPYAPGSPNPGKNPEFGDQGIQRPFSVWAQWGEAYSAAGKWPYSPGSPNPGKNPEFGDQGNQRPFAVWFNDGWEVQPPQPPTLRLLPKAALFRGDDGNEYPFLRWFLWGEAYSAAGKWPYAPGSPNPGKNPDVGDQGIEAVFVPPAPAVFFGHEQTPFVRRKPPLAADFKDDGNEFPFALWFNAGWEVQPPQPRRPHWVKQLDVGDTGTEYPLLQWKNDGWEIQPPQPPNPKQWRAAAIAIGEPGIENTYIFQSTPIVFYDATLPVTISPSLRWQRLAATKGRPEFALFDQFVAWNEENCTPYRWPLVRKILEVGDQGTEAPFVPPSTPITFGYESTPFIARRVPRQSFTPTLDGMAPFAIWFNDGWEVQPPPPPHPRPERSGAIARGDDGNEATLYVWVNDGWEVQPWQPPHPRPEKAGALFSYTVGTEGQMVFPIVPLNYGFEIQPVQPPSFLQQRSAALVGGDTGTEAAFIFVPPPPVVTSLPGHGSYPNWKPDKPGKSIRPIWDRQKDVATPATGASPVVSPAVSAPAIQAPGKPWESPALLPPLPATPATPAKPAIKVRGKLRLTEADDVASGAGTAGWEPSLGHVHNAEADDAVQAATATVEVKGTTQAIEDADTVRSDAVRFETRHISVGSREEPDQVRASIRVIAPKVPVVPKDDDEALALLNDDPVISPALTKLLMDQLEDLRPKEDPKVTARLDALEDELLKLLTTKMVKPKRR